MSGVFGHIQTNTGSRENLIKKMGEVLTHRSWHQVDTWTAPDKSAGLGRIGIGIFNPEHQPIISDDEKLIVFFTGELFPHNFRNTAPEIPAEWLHLLDSELVLALYTKYGKKAFEKLEGSFQLALFDRANETLYIANDHYGTYPLYYTSESFGFMFGPEFKVILENPEFKKELDLNALAELNKFQRLLGTKTFFKNIKRMRGGTILSYSLQTHELEEETYFDFSHIKEQHCSIEEAIETTAHLLVKAVQRYTGDDLETGVFLSGGGDSRQVAGIASRFKDPLYTISYGLPNSQDCFYAREIARKIKSRHIQFPLFNGNWIIENFDDHLNLTEGFHSWFNIHGITTIEPLRDTIKVQMNGFAGDHLYFARARSSRVLRDRIKWDDFAFRSQMFQLMSQHFSWPNMTEADSHGFYTPALEADMIERAYQSYRSELEKFSQFSGIKLQNAFFLQNHAISLTNYYNVIYRAGMEIRTPFLDYNLFNFVHGLPPEYRYGKPDIFAFGILEKVIPHLNQIPYAKDDIPLSNDPWKLLRGEIRIKSRRLLQRIFPKQVKPRPSLAVDYESLLRTDLREWAEGILFDERTLDRGIFNPDYLKSIWSRHQVGELHTIGKFAPIITYEMLLRKFYD